MNAVDVTLDAPIPAYSVFEGSFADNQSLFPNFHNPILRTQFTAVPGRKLRPHVIDLPLSLGESRPCPSWRKPEFRRKTGVGNVFLEEFRNARTAGNPRNLDSQENEAMAFNRPLPLARSQMFPCTSAAKLPTLDGEISSDCRGA